MAGLGCALLACNSEPQAQSNTSAATEIEALPPDESVEAPAEAVDAPANTDAAGN